MHSIVNDISLDAKKVEECELLPTFSILHQQGVPKNDLQNAAEAQIAETKLSTAGPNSLMDMTSERLILLSKKYNFQAQTRPSLAERGAGYWC